MVNMNNEYALNFHKIQQNWETHDIINKAFGSKSMYVTVKVFQVV